MKRKTNVSVDPLIMTENVAKTFFFSFLQSFKLQTDYLLFPPVKFPDVVLFCLLSLCIRNQEMTTLLVIWHISQFSLMNIDFFLMSLWVKCRRKSSSNNLVKRLYFQCLLSVVLFPPPSAEYESSRVWWEDFFPKQSAGIYFIKARFFFIWHYNDCFIGTDH